LTRRGPLLALILIFLLCLSAFPQWSSAAQKKTKRPSATAAASAPKAIAAVSVPAINDANLLDQFKAADEQSKKGKADEALRIFQGIYDYTRDGLSLMKCVKTAYEKGVSGPNIDQNQREELYLKLQRINSLSAQYGKLRGESAYQVGALYSRKGNVEQARKYLLEACQTVPFSLDPASTWMRSKNLLLSLSSLEGEF
jgi:tetratricopeptide (TPR) repeat protein